VSFVRNDSGQWEMSLPAPYRVDAQKLAIIEQFLTELPMKRVLRTDKAGWSAYGLDNPEITVAFRRSATSETRLARTSSSWTSATSPSSEARFHPTG
jgi:hypothetical protein